MTECVNLKLICHVNLQVSDTKSRARLIIV